MERLRKTYLWLRRKELGFCHDTKWIWRFSLVFGMIPMTKLSSGRMQFKIFSWAMLYSILLYMFFVFLSIKYIVIQRMKNLKSLSNDYDSFIYNLTFLLFMKTQFFCPISGWFSAKRIAHYYNAWMDFEVMFEKILKNKLQLKSLDMLTKRTIFINLTIAFTIIIGQQFTLPTYTFYEGIGYIPSFSGYALFNSLIYINYSAIEIASDQLLMYLKLALRKSVTQDVIVKFKKVWMDLSNLTQLVGITFSNYCLVWILAEFIDLTVSGYGFMVRFIARKKLKNDNSILTVEEFGFLVAFIVSFYLIAVCSNCAYSAKSKVEELFIDVLSFATTDPHHPKVIEEINSFLLAIQTNPPIVSLGGYVNLDRKFVTKVLSTLVTYLVVLLQFKVGFNQTNELI